MAAKEYGRMKDHPVHFPPGTNLTPFTLCAIGGYSLPFHKGTILRLQYEKLGLDFLVRVSEYTYDDRGCPTFTLVLHADEYEDGNG